MTKQLVVIQLAAPVVLDGGKSQVKNCAQLAQQRLQVLQQQVAQLAQHRVLQPAQRQLPHQVHVHDCLEVVKIQVVVVGSSAGNNR